MKKFRLTDIIPLYAVPPLAWELVWNTIVYNGVRFINSGREHVIMELPIDGAIPLICPSIVIYFGCFVFWGINYILGARQEKAEVMRFLSADFMAKTVCLVIFLIIPTTNIRPEITDTGFFGRLMTFLYTIDPADNLFPSIHCLTSWFCFIAVRKNKKLPAAYKVFSLVAALAVFVSTLTTKQHVFADVIAGFAIAELCYHITELTGFRRLYTRVFSHLPVCRELKQTEKK